ncbi:MAG: PKD domain-containing protein [Deltaproteobacteria bacterium]|nr:PKD domain-containing protein [Deltaproteobacteria bacterium]
MTRNKLSVGAIVALALALTLPGSALASHGVALVSMSQRDPANSNSTVATGGTITGSQIGFQVSSSSSTWGSGYDYRVQFEVVPAGQAFTGTPTFSSSWQPNFKPSGTTKPYPQQNYTPPATSGSWRWQVREQTRQSTTVSSTGSWTDFAGNGTGSDFVTNQPPVAEANGPYTGTQGVAVTLDATGSSDADGSITLYEWDCTSDSTYDVSGSSPTGLTCTYADDGIYTATLRVTDDGGSQATDTAGVTIPNAAPTAEANGPYTGTRGFGVAVSAAGSTDSDGAIVSYEWDCDGDTVYEQSSAGPTGTSCTYAAVGSYTVGLRVTDDDGGTATDTATVTVGNDPPTADAGGPYSGDEGSAIALNGSASADVGGGVIVQWEWDCTDDGVYDVVSMAGTGNACTYTDDGVFTVRVRVTDDDAATATATATVTVGNVAPSITSASGPSTGDEGSTLSFSAAGTDPATADVLTYSWNWGDSTADTTGSAPTHVWDDEGTYTVTVTLSDDDGGTDTDTLNVVVSNVAPTITSTPTLTASEGVQWTYAPAATDPGADTLVWSLSSSAPAAMTFDTATGAMSWTPDYADAVAGVASMVLTVDDGDTGTDAQSITVVIVVADTDGDGLPDGWELANGLDPNDPSDATGDPDADGLTNLDELAEGTDPQSYDGPDAPVLTEPIGGDEVADSAPDLYWTNATDPQGEELAYDVEVYEDAALTVLATSAMAVVEDLSGTSTWKVDIGLAENATYYWRARANDAWTAGPWSVEESFVVNATNEAPDAPVLSSPIGGEIAASATPTLQWAEVIDIDGDSVTYDVEVYDDAEVLVTSTFGVVGTGSSAEWTVDTALLEDEVYWWTARAVDEHGLAGDWSADESFFLSTENAAPFGVAFIDPPDQATLDSTPVLVASEGEDPEGGDLDYLFEVDSSPSFDSAGVQEATLSGTGTGTVSWDLPGEGITLQENAWSYARVRAIDEGGVTSTPDTISFFVRGENDAPDVPVLLSPADGSETEAAPTLEVEDPADPEGDVVFIDFIVARDAELTDVIDGAEGVVAGGGTTVWSVGVNLEGTVYWSARAVDADGATSDWAAPWSLVAPTAEVPGDDDDDDDGGGTGGCDCASSVSGEPSASAWALLLLLVPVLVRRRR